MSRVKGCHRSLGRDAGRSGRDLMRKRKRRREKREVFVASSRIRVVREVCLDG